MSNLLQIVVKHLFNNSFHLNSILYLLYYHILYVYILSEDNEETLFYTLLIPIKEFL